MDFLLSGIMEITWQQCIMYAVGVLLIYLAIAKGLEPSLLLPMGLGAILVNIPFTGVLGDSGIIEWLFKTGIEASEALPILLFVGIGAMIDFGPLLSNPKMFLFGAAAQFGISATAI
jgi:oxaloacetate decarboxylase beta subunit